MRVFLTLCITVGLAHPATAEPTSKSESDSGRSENPDALLTTLGLVLITGIAVGAGSVRAADKAEAERRLAAYLKANEPGLTRDLLLAEGPLLDGWLAELGLTAEEAVRFRGALEGSAAQAGLVAALSQADAPTFARTFRHLLTDAVGPTRLIALESRVLGG